jgi:hypothetical protein
MDADDRVLTGEHRARLLSVDVLVEEKLDGANVAVWFDDGAPNVATRGGPDAVDRGGLRGRLRAWSAEHADALAAALGDRLVMYGEWLLIRHRVRYDRLTSPFVGLDVLDLVSGQFHPIPERDAVLGRASVPPPPKLFRGQLGSLAAVEALMGPSAFGGEPAEGIIVRALMPDAAGPRIAKLLAAPGGTPTAQAPA